MPYDLDRLRQMPALNHFPDRSQKFDFERSEVIRYIRDEYGATLMEAIGIFTKARKKKVIVFDADSKLWEGTPVER